MSMLDAMLTKILGRNAWSIASRAMHVRNARTHKELLTLREHVALGNARRGGSKIRPIRGENSRTAHAARGLAVSHA